MRFLSWECWDILKTTRSFPKIPEEARSLPKTSEVYRSLRARINASSLPVQGIVIYSFFHTVFVPYVDLSQHIFGNCVKQDGNNSHFSIRREKLARRREPT